MKIELDNKQARAFRSIAARCLDLSPDRPDIQYAVKEVCRQMATPTKLGILHSIKEEHKWRGHQDWSALHSHMVAHTALGCKIKCRSRVVYVGPGSMRGTWHADGDTGFGQ